LDYKSTLSEIKDFLDSYESIWNKEIIYNYPNTLKAYDIQHLDLLNQLSDDELWKIDARFDFSPIKDTPLFSLIEKTMSFNQIINKYIPTQLNLPLLAFTRIKDKKHHELDNLIPLIIDLKHKLNFKTVIDIGGGVGHLSRILGSYFNTAATCIDINQDFFNQNVEVSGLIEQVTQTGGPTIFVVSDGTATLALKGFVGQGQRAYPEIDMGDTIKAVVTINEYNGELEGEIEKIEKLNPEEHKVYLEKIIHLQKKRAEVKEIDFLVKSEIIEKLKPLIIKAAFEIRLAIIQNRPIIIRHHNDTDGYCAGYALEKAILPLIEKEHGSEKAGYEFFMRSPCQAPFYEIDDSIRDTANSLRNVAKFSNKMPLVIITDNGSTPEDLFGIKQGKLKTLQNPE